MDIGFYIADLLRNQDEVSLPGLGTFTKERVAGSYDSSSNTFRPPSYQVSFDNRSNDFSTLSEYISTKKNLSRSSAEYFVKKFTTTISELLQTSGTAEVKPLGIIRQNNDVIIFEASQALEVSGKYYGLKPVLERTHTFEPQVAEAQIPLNEAVGNSISTEKGSFIEDFITGQGSETQEEEEEEYFEETRGNKTPLIILVTLLLGLVTIVLLYLFNPATRNIIDGMFLGPAPAASAASASDSLISTASPVPPDSGSRQQTAIDTPANDAVSTPPENKNTPVEVITYEIVGATFGKRSEAESYIKTMKSKGIEARILENMPGTLFKVSIGSFPDSKTAQDALNRIVKEVEKSAWTTKYKSTKTQ